VYVLMVIFFGGICDDRALELNSLTFVFETQATL
jgi:hypothetical protein